MCWPAAYFATSMLVVSRIKVLMRATISDKLLVVSKERQMHASTDLIYVDNIIFGREFKPIIGTRVVECCLLITRDPKVLGVNPIVVGERTSNCDLE
jgi:hypothetical protein